MATYCPNCEKPIRTGQRIRGQFICDFKEESSGIHHGIQLISEEWVEHEVCDAAPEGD